MSEDAPLWWEDGALVLIDQTALPHQVRTRRCTTWEEVGDAILNLQVRGAPAIGLAAAYGLVLAAMAGSPEAPGTGRNTLLVRVRQAAAALRAIRPTAVNLAWALDRVLGVAEASPGDEDLPARLLCAAAEMAQTDREANRRIGRHGAGLLARNARVMTYCNTGMLATGGYGTAFGVLRRAHEEGLGIRVIACETRPVLQGARLTMWELQQTGIPAMLVTDNAAGMLMRAGEVDAVIVGADRIAANGDVANKIGTYTLAVLARAHQLPFYVAAPLSTVDLSTPSGDRIPIEERSPDEVTTIAGTRVAPAGAAARNPAFDITPHALVTAIITEAGVVLPPFDEGLRRAYALRNGQTKALETRNAPVQGGRS
jgi:methylthioribose-1-phosphate isomerase